MSARLLGAGREGRLWAPAAIYAVVTAVLWPIPVFGALHAEASAVTAGVGFLIAGLFGARSLRGGRPLRLAVRDHLTLLTVPWGMLTLALLWRPNCAYLQGLGLYVLLVPPSVLLGVALAFALTEAGVRRTGTAVVTLGLVVGAGGVLVDLLWHPQLFTYSHVFGGVLGPIYDAELAVRPGLFAAKAQTLLWAAALVAFGRWRGGGGAVWSRLGAALLLALGASYVFSVPLGIQQSARNIQTALSQRVDLGPLVLHLAPEAEAAEVARLADEASFRFEAVVARLGVRPSEPVDVYLYPDPETKARLIGSRLTSVVPVWLPTPQVHMLAGEVPRSLGHELVHVVAREFGAPVLKASPAVGLVEGLAVALEPPDGLPDAAALVRAGQTLGGDTGGLDENPARVVERVMGPLGFWTARAGVAYTASGAFTGWLLDRYGPEAVREAYATGDIDGAFGQPLVRLSDAWAADLARAPVDPEAVSVAAWLFRRPSLFEVRCPHHTPRPARLAREGWRALDEGRPRGALAAFDEAVRLDPLGASALDGRQTARARLGLAPHPEAAAQVRALADSLGDAASLRLLADALRLGGHVPEADAAYRAAADSLSPVDAFGRLLLTERAALDAATLRRLLAADSADARLAAATPILAAFVEASGDRPEAAWQIARRWRGLGSGKRRAALRLLQAQMAYRAGAVEAAGRLAAEAAAEFRAAGPQSLVAVAEDWAARAEWRARRDDRNPVTAASIFGPRISPHDGLRPACCPTARAPGSAPGVRAAG